MKYATVNTCAEYKILFLCCSYNKFDILKYSILMIEYFHNGLLIVCTDTPVGDYVLECLKLKSLCVAKYGVSLIPGGYRY